MALTKRLKNMIGFFTGLACFLLIILFFKPEPFKPELNFMLAIAVLMAVWWITEAIPLAVTALVPVALFPLFGIMNGTDVSSTYFNHVIFLFIGGFMIALAMQKWSLHKRIALKLLLLTGASPGRILLGFMLSTAFLSMWISNTATAMMMIPIVVSVIEQLEENIGKKNISNYSTGLLLGIAYSASIGGVATLVGTPPNLSFVRILSINFPDAPQISFSTWFVFALPLTLILLLIVWVFLSIVFRSGKTFKDIGIHNHFGKQYQQLGKMSFEEKMVLGDFIIVALLWIFRADINVGSLSVPGWGDLFNHPDYLNDGTVAIFMAIILFLIPSKSKKGERLLDWPTARKLPWGIVLLFGGGFALAAGFKESGLSLWFGEQLSFTRNFHPILIIASICFLVTFLTELTSNTATTEMLLPILAGLSIATEVNPL
ncbi:MAG: SLC13/DASS family transporter, partial [Prolixibacteraceae bacterium]|nr:SLC13/DASS family transporter [Prolixibacteraceae bacterium]